MKKIQERARHCKIKEYKNRLILVIDGVPSIKSGINWMKELKI
jgi:transcription-repair coupling factor (superfamily II helicase)